MVTSSVDKVFTPGPGEIFVFGSNDAGIHGAGAARTAHKHYGAIWGVGEGLMGNSYALPTKDKALNTKSLDEIWVAVQKLFTCADSFRTFNFFVTRIGCGLAGYQDEQIGPMFKNCPPNLTLPWGWGNEDRYDYYR